MGADECVGFDISDEAIKEANERAALCQIDCQFIRSDVYEIAAEHDNHFDIAYVRAGGMGWLPDLKLFVEIIAALLRNDGLLFMHEVHTMSSVMMSLIDNGIAIEYFSESPTALSPNHRHIEEADAGIPLSYFLIGGKRNSH